MIDFKSEEFKEFKESIDNVNLREVLNLLGFSGGEDNVKNKYKVYSSDGETIGNISIKGNSWFNHNLEKGGVGAISLIRHIENLEFIPTLKFLSDLLGEDIGKLQLTDAEKKKEVKEVFNPPIPHIENLPKVKNYLKNVRMLDEQLIDKLIKAGKIYADEHANCIFFAKGIAEIRSTNKDYVFKGLATGSTRKHGFSVPQNKEKDEHKIACVEAAIDAISYNEMHEGQFVISNAGAGHKFPISIAIETIDNDYSFVCAFDGDNAGDTASQYVYNYFFVRAYFEKKLGISNEDFDALYEGEFIEVDIQNEELFFSHEDIFEKYEALELEKKAKNEVFKWPLYISYTVKKTSNLLTENLNNSINIENKLSVRKSSFDYIKNTYNLERNRPKLSKDWNEDLQQLKKNEMLDEYRKNYLKNYSRNKIKL